MSEKIIKIATREAYGGALAEFGEKYKNIVVLDADLSKSTKTADFEKKFPERFINCGIAEGNMTSVAAGIAAAGKIPFMSSFAMFAAGRAYEQIRNSIGYPGLNVKIGATHAGITVGEDGATHQCCEDLGIMRTIPGMVILNPADAVEARLAVEAAILHKGPVYMRFGRFPVPVIFDKDSYKFEIGRGVQISEGKDAAIIATGILVDEAIKARKILAAENIDAAVVNIHTIKPIDKDIIVNAAKTGVIVTAEEHNIIGGLGSAVAEVLAENSPCLMGRIGIKDVFGRSGKGDELMKIYEITAEDIAKKVREVMKLKR
ncbi:MAG: transketolase family protein [Oscillospiraceae bacterium]|nr:transketolase family protein [Oscillospiraceae bacterium]